MGGAKNPWSSQLVSQLAGDVISGREGCSWEEEQKGGWEGRLGPTEGTQGQTKDQGFISHTQQPTARAVSQGGPHVGQEQLARSTELSKDMFARPSQTN